MTTSIDTIEKRRLDLHGIPYAVVDVGEGPAVLLLHGFPDSSYLWRRQIPVLLEAGYRVVAPDLRGFGDSGKPEGVAAYRLNKVVADMTALMRRLGVVPVDVVGHDWGAVVGWLMASLVARQVSSLTAISVGHPHVFDHPSIEQRERSWYMLFYQFEGVAEKLLQRHNWRLFREILGGAVDTERYVQDLGRPGALTAALNWYRANRAPAVELDTTPDLPPIVCPTMGVWSSGDAAMTEQPMLDSAMHVRGSWRYERVEDCDHWVPTGAPGRLNDLLLDFLSKVERDRNPVATRRRL